MKRQIAKKYAIKVGIDYPDIDDVFTIELELYPDEIQSIIKGGIKEKLRKDRDLYTFGPWDYIQAFAPQAYKRAVKSVEEYAVPKWGEKMLVKNGAEYIFFLPEEISNAIAESDEP